MSHIGKKQFDKGKIQRRFKPYIKRLRKDSEMSQRKLADLIKRGQTFVAELESPNPHRWAWPSDEALTRMAQVLGANRDEMLGKAGRISQDVQEIIIEHPIEICAFLRAAKDLSAEDWEFLTEQRNADIEYNEEWDKQAELCSECGK